MGFSTTFGLVVDAAVTHASNLVGDLNPVLGLLFGVAVVSALLGSLRRFMP